MAVIIRGETITTQHVAGLILIITGIAISKSRPKNIFECVKSPSLHNKKLNTEKNKKTNMN